MKILMVSMPCLHFFRWAEQLQDSGHEVYWFDVTDGGKKVERIHWVKQIIAWKFRWDYPGRSFIKINFPRLYAFIQQFNERDVKKIFEQHLLEIQPDVVHSFALYISCSPIIEVMQKHPEIKWIYSSWGSDLYDFQNIPTQLDTIKKVLPRINYMFSDCLRDYEIAKKQGFKNTFLGVYPGGGGYFLDKMDTFLERDQNKNGIAIKGFQGKWGRAIEVLKALLLIENEIKSLPITIFGADEEVSSFVEKSALSNWENLSLFGKIRQQEVWRIMGKSNIYIGNSISDGMPNTMLEAICMEVLPIQSNPGGVTQELIKDGFNGFLIQDAEDVKVISRIILKAITNNEGVKKGIIYNSLNIKPILDYDMVKNKVLQSYLRVLQDN